MEEVFVETAILDGPLCRICGCTFDRCRAAAPPKPSPAEKVQNRKQFKEVASNLSVEESIIYRNIK